MSTFVLHGSSDRSPKKIDYGSALNEEQLNVVLHGDGPCLVLAGAGSGKTRTLTYRVAYLLEQGVDPSSILLLTFTNKAAREMLSRVAMLLGAEARGIWGGTFHATANRLLRVFADAVGYAERFSILDSEDTRDLLKAILKDLRIDPKARRFPSAAVVQDVVSYARNSQSSIAQVVATKYPNFVGCVDDLERIAERYQIRKRAALAMDFDDLLLFLALLLEDPVRGSQIASRFRYVLVDEYQDTNAIQARIVRGFASVHRNILAVGDDAQSIYAFRGADVRNILSFPSMWPHASVYKLLTNYRSTPEILDLANASLSHNVDQFEKDLVAVCGNGSKPRYVPCTSASQEAQYVAEQLLQLRHEGVALRNMAVLFRSSAHSQALEFELMKRDIPYEYRGGQKFFERAHIKDVVCFLRLTHNVLDEVAWLRVLGLQVGIGLASASTIVSRVQGKGDLRSICIAQESFDVPARAKEGWREFCSIGQDLYSAGDRPSEMIRQIAESSYREYLQREYPNWRERLEDIEQLALFAEGYETVAPFLIDVALYDEVVAGRQDAGSSTADDERMILSTIHQAKGLEWDAVFVIHLAEGAFPSRRALGEPRGMEEERRLFYVAVTRARRQLFLTYPMTMGYDALAFNQVSTFVEEVSPRLFERVELRESRSYGSGGGGGGDWEESAWDEPTIEIDAKGDRHQGRTPTVWKTSPSKKDPL